jgi:hypothetical protein
VWLAVGLARRSLRFTLLAALLALAALPITSASAGNRIVGGSNAAVGQFPYQVYLEIDFPDGTAACGGSILNSTHIITAAHCVEDIDSGFYPRILSPSDISRIAHGGTDITIDGSGNDVTDYGGTVTRVSVDRRRNRNLGSDADDSALLTISPGLTLGANTNSIPLAAPSDLSGQFGFGRPPSAPEDKPFISGWGLEDENDTTAPDDLQFARVALVSDGTCQNTYGSSLVASVMLCAGEPGATPPDTCQGDSGGPLALDGATGANSAPGANARLAGITSFGNGCGRPNTPGVYTEVSEAGTTSFLNSAPPNPPSLLGTTTITGTPRVGQALTCHTPSLPAGVTTQRHFWYAVSGGSATEFAETTGASVTLPAATVGLRVGCDARVENAGGYQYIEFASAVGPVAAAPTPPGPAPKDTTKPRASVRKIRCKRRRCTFTFKATDPGGLVKKTRARVKGKYKKCRRVRGHRRCRSKKVNKRLRLRKKGGGIYTAKLRLKRGKYKVAFIATDAAGNKSKTARKKFRVR